MTTPTPFLFPLGRMRDRSGFWRRAVALAGGAALAGTLAAQAPIVSDQPARPIGPGQQAAPASGGSPAGAREVLPNPLTPHEAKLTASDGAPADLFGSGSVAIFEDRAVIGAVGDDDLGISSGAAYVFERQADGIWAEVVKLTASSGAEGDEFGNAVAVSGERALVGAHQADDLDLNSGSAYLFERQADGTWAEVAKLTATDGRVLAYFGSSVALSGDTALVGAPSDLFGAAYVFERQADGTWAEVAKLTASDGSLTDFFGRSIALSPGRALIGAPAGSFPGRGPGSAYIFEGQGRTWAEVAKLTASDGGDLDSFGSSVALSGDTALVGAYLDDDLGSNSGAAYVFERQADGTWAEAAKLTASDGAGSDYLGYSVALSGERALVGAYLADDRDRVTRAGGSNFGSAFVFERQADETWAEVVKITAADGAAGDFFGYSVALSGERALIGANHDDDVGSDSGSAYVYSLEGCELALELEPATLRAGEQLRVAVDLHHRRPITVTVPFLMWIEDAAGHVVARKSSPPITMEPGDHRQLRLAVSLPPGMLPGTYRVLVGVRRMQQGIAWASQQFEIVE